MKTYNLTDHGFHKNNVNGLLNYGHNRVLIGLCVIFRHLEKKIPSNYNCVIDSADVYCHMNLKKIC